MGCSSRLDYKFCLKIFFISIHKTQKFETFPTEFILDRAKVNAAARMGGGDLLGGSLFWGRGG